MATTFQSRYAVIVRQRFGSRSYLRLFLATDPGSCKGSSYSPVTSSWSLSDLPFDGEFLADHKVNNESEALAYFRAWRKTAAR